MKLALIFALIGQFYKESCSQSVYIEPTLSYDDQSLFTPIAQSEDNILHIFFASGFNDTVCVYQNESCLFNGFISSSASTGYSEVKLRVQMSNVIGTDSLKFVIPSRCKYSVVPAFYRFSSLSFSISAYKWHFTYRENSIDIE